MMRHIFTLAALFSISSLSMAATFDFNLGDAVFARDGGRGSTTNWKEIRSDWQVDVLCDTEILNTTEVFAPIVPGFTDVYQTSHPAIGVRYKVQTWHTASPLLTIPFSSAGVGCKGWNRYIRIHLRAAVQLVQLGPLTGGGKVDVPRARMLTYYNDKYREPVELIAREVPDVRQSSCHVGGDVSVQMPSIGLHDLPSTGSTAGRTAFNIRMVCDPSIAVHMVMTDASNPGNTGNVLALGADSKGTGVGYQILHDSKPISFGPASPIKGALNQFKVVDSTGAAGGQYSIPFHAQYYRTTSSPPRAGNANAKATFTMSYQ